MKFQLEVWSLKLRRLCVTWKATLTKSPHLESGTLVNWGPSSQELEATSAAMKSGSWDLVGESDDDDGMSEGNRSEDLEGAAFMEELESRAILDAYRYDGVYREPPPDLNPASLHTASSTPMQTPTQTPRKHRGSVSPQKRPRRESWDVL